MRRRLVVASAAVVVLGAGVLVALLVRGSDSDTAQGHPSATSLPCDIYARAHAPCVGAYSTTRALYANFDGALYRVRRASDGASTDIDVDARGGYARAHTQDTFCARTTCSITTIFDQSPRHNDLTVAGPGHAGPQNMPARAAALPVTVDGHHVYGVELPPQTGYRHRLASGTARDGAPESMYEVADATFVNARCCSDFGNVEADEVDTGKGHMDAVSVSAIKHEGSAPHVRADLENGLWEGNTRVNPKDTALTSPFVTAMLENNGRDHFALEGGDATHATLSTFYDGPLPPAYQPMHQEGSIVLGTGGDNSNRARGRFFEGVITAGYASHAADIAVQADIAAVHYAKG